MDFDWVTWGIIVGVIIGLIPIVSKAIDEQYKVKLATFIKELRKKRFPDMIRGLNRFFIELFDKLYAGSYESGINRFLWYFVLIGFGIELAMLFVQFADFSENILNFILLISVVFALSISTGIEIVKYLNPASEFSCMFWTNIFN